MCTMKKSLGFVVGIILIAGLAFFTWHKQSEQVSPIPQEVVTPPPAEVTSPEPVPPIVREPARPSTPTPPPTQPEAKTITRADVAIHNSAQSCYVIIGAKVYDVTTWISKHPGGPEKILGLCGTDGTATFSRQHGSNAKAQAALASFYIAPLQ